MTTIITNGYYLAADHRTTFTSVERRFDIETGEKAKEGVFSDTAYKIHLVPADIQFYHGDRKVIAIACSGAADAGGLFMEFLDVVAKTKKLDIQDVIKIHRTLRGATSFTVVGVTEDAHSFLMPMRNHSERKVAIFSPGKMIMAGSGVSVPSAWDDVNEAEKSTVTVGDLVLTASRYDNSTSPSYSVFGVREKEYYAAVIPSKEDVDKAVTKVFHEMQHGCYVGTRRFLNSTTHERVEKEQNENVDKSTKPAA